VAEDRIKAAQQRLVFCRLMFDIMRNLHSSNAPATEPFGDRLETLFVGLCVALGQIDGKPFSVAKIAAYMHLPRATVTRRLSRLQSWRLLYKKGHHYYVHEKPLNSLIGMRSYQRIRGMLRKANEELTALDAAAE
jgi:hypothetical protein